MNKTEILIYIDKKLGECSTKNTLADTSTELGKAQVSYIAGQIDILKEIFKLI